MCRKKRTMSSQLLPPPPPPPPEFASSGGGGGGGGGGEGWRRHLADRMPPLPSLPPTLSQDVSVAGRVARRVLPLPLPTPRLQIKSKWARKGRRTINNQHNNSTELCKIIRARLREFLQIFPKMAIMTTMVVPLVCH